MRRVDTSDSAEIVKLREFLAEAERFDGYPPVSDQALLAVSQGRRELFAADDAYGILGEGELDLVVRPTARGRRSGREALAHLLEAHAEAGTGAERRQLRAWAHGQNPEATALLEHAGFEAVRELLRMSLDPQFLEAAIAQARPMPEGFEVRDFKPRQTDDTAPDAGGQSDDADEWVRVNAAAFAGHAEQGAMTRSDFEGLTEEPWFDAEDLRLAFDTRTGRLAGFTWIKTTRDDGVVETELYAIGVDPAHSGKGLGAALLGETMQRMRVHAPHRITLYVDGDNFGARALYERAGFEVDQRSTQWRR